MVLNTSLRGAAARRLIVGAAYVALILAFTWPLAANLTTSVVLARGSDVWPHLWNFAWVRTALLDLHRSPYSTHSIFYPSGVPLVYHALNLFSAVVSLPLQTLFGLLPAFNLLMIGNLIAAALAAYWLARVLALDAGPAFLAGALYACSPPIAASFDLGQGELVSVFWLPLYLGLLLRGCGLRARGLPPGPWPYRLAAGLALAGSALAIWYWFVSLLVLTAVYGLLELWWASRLDGRPAMGAVIGRLLAVGTVALVVLSPLLLLMVREQMGSGADLGIGGTSVNNEVVFLSSQDPLAWLQQPWQGPLAPHGRTIGFGWKVLLVAFAGIVLVPGQRRRGAVLWGAAALVMAVLALGPELVLNEVGTGVPLPYALIMQIPGAAAMRVPLRFDTPLALCLAVLAATGVAEALAYLRRRRISAVVCAAGVLLLGAALMSDFFHGPRPLIQPETQRFFTALAAHPSPCLGELQQPLSACDAILELPQANWAAPAMYHQAISRHPVLGGYISRHYPYDFAVTTPGVAQLVTGDPAGLGDDILGTAGREVALQAMDYYGVRYIVVHPAPDYPRAVEQAETLRQLFPGGGQVADGLTVYTVPSVPQARTFLFLGDDWYNLEQNAAGGRWRWTDQAATAHIVTPAGAAGPHTLRLEVFALGGPRTLVIALDGQEIARATVAVAPGTMLTVPLDLPAGEHLLGLAAVEPAISPPGDRRSLSLAYRAVAVTKP